MRRTRSAGGVVLNARGQVLVVNQRGRSWSLPKGHVEDGEDLLAAARREIYEESGLRRLQYVRLLGSYERPKISRTLDNDLSELKHLTFYLFRTDEEELRPVDADNPEARWVDREKVPGLLTHPQDRHFFVSIASSL